MTTDIAPLATTAEMVDELRAGRMIILVDDEDRENEGDFVVAGECITVEHVVQMNRLASGIITVPMPAPWLSRLHLESMVPDNAESMRTAFTVTVDARDGVSTGSSAHDRVHTIRRLADPQSSADEFVRPGHVGPLIVRDGGVLKRAGHTEASHDLMAIAGLSPVAVLCEIMGDDGEMMRLPALRELGEHMGVRVGTIAEIIRYRHRHERLVVRLDTQQLDTPWGPLTVHRYRSAVDEGRYTVLVRGEVEPERPTLARIHAATLTGDLLGLLGGADVHPLRRALDRIAAEEHGVVLYIERPGEAGPMDARDYGIGAQILREVGAKRLRLLTDHPRRRAALEGFGLQIVDFVPLTAEGGLSGARPEAGADADLGDGPTASGRFRVVP